MSEMRSAVLLMMATPHYRALAQGALCQAFRIESDALGHPAQIDELHKMSALMGPPTMDTWPEGVMLGIGMGFSFVPQQPIPLQLMVRTIPYQARSHLQSPQ